MKVINADYHRNGVGGTGFYVGLVEHEGETLVVVAFDDPDDPTHTAVLNPAKAVAGNIFMHPTDEVPNSGGAAYRGDRFSHLRPEFARIVNERLDRLVESLRADPTWRD